MRFLADECYFSQGHGEPRYYQPSDRGLEGKIAEKLERLRELDRKARGGIERLAKAGWVPLFSALPSVIFNRSVKQGYPT